MPTYHHSPAALTVGQYHLPNEPLLGGNLEASVVAAEGYALADFAITQSGTGVLTANTSDAARQLADPRHVVVMLDTPIADAGADIIFTVSGVDINGASFIDGRCVFQIPAYAQNQTRTFERCWTQDLVLQATGAKVASISAVAVSCQAGANNSRFKFFGVPDLTAFAKVGCSTQMGFNIRAQEGVPVACRLNPSAFTVGGMLQEGRLAVGAKQLSEADGLNRFVGRKVTGLLEAQRFNKVVTERYLFLSWWPTSTKDVPEGVGVVMAAAQGPCEEVLVLIAPTS